MRILSLGFPLPGPSVTNYTFTSAPAFFDYDALIIDPAALTQLIEEVVDGTAEHATATGERVVNGPGGPSTVALADLLRDRRDETARLLHRGGLVVCIAQPNVAHERVAGFAGCDRYFWLPAPAGLQYREPFLRRGFGDEIGAPERDHPFGPFVAEFRGRLAYRAYFADDAEGFAGTGRVIARSAGGAAVGIELTLGHGRVVFLPAPARSPSSSERYALSQEIQEAVRRALRLASGSSEPGWLADYTLPGLRGRREERAAARDRVSGAQDQLAARDDAVEDLERYRRILWQEGAYGLEQPVRDALTILGFQVTQDLETAAQLRHDGRLALLEAEGSEDAVGMEGHYRLRSRLEEGIAKGTSQRGLLVINGHRRQPPSERPAQYEEPLRAAAERLGYCVATTEQLFHALRAALAGDDATVSAFRERLLATDGVLRED